MSSPLKNILIYGGGLALEYAAATLTHALPSSISLTVVEDPDCAKHDAFYGSVMPPVAYNFNRTANIEEPDLIRNTNTGLSYGTQYNNWANSLSWVQCYSLPLPIWNGVRFHHYLKRIGAPLEPFLPGAAAGKAGRFAHPPQDPKVILSRAEYGYQFCPQEIAGLLKSRTTGDHLKRVKGKTTDIATSDGNITSITLASGEKLSADLFIDASGPAGALISCLSATFNERYPVTLTTSETPSTTGGASLRQVTGTETGWTARTELRNKALHVAICHPDDSPSESSEENITLTAQTGAREHVWVGNCISIGHAASLIDPLTTASFLLLMRDIERLIGLVPPNTQMMVEAREYNRRFKNDFEHASLFHMAMFHTTGLPMSNYYQSVVNLGIPEKLARKISQFENRGDLVAYDLEPFNEQDWTTLHFGMGRPAKRHDIYIDNISNTTIEKNLMAMKQEIEALVTKMPPHGTYLMKLQQYLERKHG